MRYYVSQSSSPVERRLAKILRERKEPHGKLLKDKEILKGVEVSEGGIVELWITPTHPYCPCCVNDLIEPVSYTHLRAPRDRTRSRMPSSA